MRFKFRLIPNNRPQMTPGTILNIAKHAVKADSEEEIEGFEEEFAKYIGTKHAITFSSGRFALYLLYKYFGCRGRKIVMPAYTCIPVPDSVRWAGSEPSFLDIDLNTYNPIFSDKIRKQKNIGAVLLSYLYGLVGDLDEFLEYAEKHDVPVIEDAAIAVGAKYKKRKVGSLGDAAMFSLQSSKIMTGWNGGVITTNDDKLAEYLTGIRSKQKIISRGRVLFNLSFTYLKYLLFSPHTYGFTFFPFRSYLFKKGIIGEAVTGESPKDISQWLNSRFSSMQASVARSQLRNIETILEKRRGNARKLNSKLKSVEGVSCPQDTKNSVHSYGRYPVRIAGVRKFDLASLFLKNGIEIAENYPYVCSSTKHMKRYGFKDSSYPNSVKAAKETFLLPFYSSMNKSDILKIVDAVRDITEDKKSFS